LHLDATQNIASLIHQCKGASSRKINQEKWFEEEFKWSVGYAAFSVSQSLLGKVRNYILEQERHHEKLKFREEYNQLLKLHNLELENFEEG
jgi:REP element-mobilizing transposase RayT